MSSSRPPKTGEKVYVAYTQVYATILECGPVIRHSKGDPVWRVMADRRGNIHELDVVRDSHKGRLHPAAGGVLHANIKGGI